MVMDGFTGFKTVAAKGLPHAVEVLDPFHVVKFGSEALVQIRQRVHRNNMGGVAGKMIRCISASVR